VGLVLTATCDSCAYERADLRLGATHAQIEAHDVSTRELFRAVCCKQVVSVLVLHGGSYPETPCEECEDRLDLSAETRYRIATLKGEVFRGHPCPSCASTSLRFEPTGKFV
jgi:hypothetical protein